MRQVDCSLKLNNKSTYFLFADAKRPGDVAENIVLWNHYDASEDRQITQMQQAHIRNKKPRRERKGAV